MIVLFSYASVHHFAISLVHLRFHSVYHVVQIHCRRVSVCYSDIEICRYEHFVRLIFYTQLKFNNQSFRQFFSPCTNKNNWVGVCVQESVKHAGDFFSNSHFNLYIHSLHYIN